MSNEEQPAQQQGFSICKNLRCHKRSRIHALNEHCDYDVTGQCEAEGCAIELIEKDRQYSLRMFGKVLCALHSGDVFWRNTAEAKRVKPEAVRQLV